jgi:hypothetical protein
MSDSLDLRIDQNGRFELEDLGFKRLSELESASM